MRVIHLNRSGSGIASKTACGRSIYNTPFSGDWEDFRNTTTFVQCEKCAASAYAKYQERIIAAECAAMRNR